MKDKDSSELAPTYTEQLAQSIQSHTPLVAPLTASLGITYRCNSQCTHCLIWKAPPTSMALANAKLAVDALCDLGVYMISLTGGEPFLHNDLPHIVAYIRQRGCLSNTMTNGLLLKPARLRPVLEAGLNSLCLSLDTLDATTYAAIRGVPLAPVLRGLQYVLEERAHFPQLLFSLNCVITRLNMRQVIPLVEYCHSIGVSIGFQPLHPTFANNGHQEATPLTFREEDLLELQELIATLKQMRQEGFPINSSEAYLDGFPDFLVYRRLPQGFQCAAGFTSVTIDHQLQLRSCWSMNPVGDLHTHNCNDLWVADVFRQRRAAMLELQCPGCWFRCHTEERSVQWLEHLMSQIHPA